MNFLLASNASRSIFRGAAAGAAAPGVLAPAEAVTRAAEAVTRAAEAVTRAAREVVLFMGRSLLEAGEVSFAGTPHIVCFFVVDVLALWRTSKRQNIDSGRGARSIFCG